VSTSSQPLFFDWKSPWLSHLATYLFHTWNQGTTSSQEDLSSTVVVLPGRRAGRRLLELLALEAEKEQRNFIPPTIVTLREAVTVLMKPSEQVLPEGSVTAQRLAWHQAFRELPRYHLENIHPFSKTAVLSSSGEALLGIIESLAKEMGSKGLDFQAVAIRVGEIFPESAEREEPRWKALAYLQQSYRDIMASWGYSDPTDFLRSCLTSGEVSNDRRVLVAGVVEFAPLFQSFYEKTKPNVIIIAPQEHAQGFTNDGLLVKEYWLDHPAIIQDAQLIPCERSEDQAEEVVRLITHLKDTISHVTVAVQDVATLPLLQNRLENVGIPTRWAGGLPFRGGRLYQLLQAIAHFLDHNNYSGPTLAAMSALVRHPDIYPHCTFPELLLKKLDLLEREQLPIFLDKVSLASSSKNEDLLVGIEELETLIGVDSEPLSLEEGASKLRTLLLRLFGKRQVHAETSEGHYFLGCLEECLQILEEIEEISPYISERFSMSLFLETLLDLLREKNIPEQEEPEALELLGWLELQADDAPYTIITSCHEGFFPQSERSNPFLSQGLRSRLGLSEEGLLLARDHYLLQGIVASRQVILIAPRYNGRGEPARPSRLLMMGLALEELPQRVLQLTEPLLTRICDTDSAAACEHLTDTASASNCSSGSMKHTDVVAIHHLPCLHQDSQRLATNQYEIGGLKEEKERGLSHHVSQFHARPLGTERVTRVTVTGLRTYLQSPRLFYLQHVLRLQEVEEPPLEMHAGHFGRLIHEVLGAFGMEEKNIPTTDVQKLSTWLRRKLFSMAKQNFAPGPSLPIQLQLEAMAETLDGFAQAQVAHHEEGWRIIAAENHHCFSSPVLEERIVFEEGGSLLLQGRIDRIDWNQELRRWMIIDYKTRHDQEWKNATPNREHFQKKGEEIFWKDFQLPLYLKLAPCWKMIQESGLPLPTIENTDLCYFQLPMETEQAGLSETFDSKMIVPAWTEATRMMKAIVDGNFDRLGEIEATRMPTLAALCGISILEPKKIGLNRLGSDSETVE
jgi:hypothetical protein